MSTKKIYDDDALYLLTTVANKAPEALLPLAYTSAAFYQNFDNNRKSLLDTAIRKILPDPSAQQDAYDRAR